MPLRRAPLAPMCRKQALLPLAPQTPFSAGTRGPRPFHQEERLTPLTPMSRGVELPPEHRGGTCLSLSPTGLGPEKRA